MIGIDNIIAIGGKLLDKIIPDPQARDAAKLKLLELEQSGELRLAELDNMLAMGQIETNKIEAADASLFKSSWRPCIGWCCALAIFYDFLLRPLLSGFLFKYGFVFPELDSSTLMSLTLSLLGMGTLRSFEKFKGVSR